MNFSFDHIGILSRDINEGKIFLENTLMITHWGEPIFDPLQEVIVQFGKNPNDHSNETIYELITPASHTSPINNSLKNKTNIINHFAYRVPDLELSSAHLQKNRCIAITVPKPAIAFGGRKVQFFYSPMDFIIELITDK